MRANKENISLLESCSFSETERRVSLWMCVCVLASAQPQPQAWAEGGGVSAFPSSHMLGTCSFLPWLCDPQESLLLCLVFSCICPVSRASVGIFGHL